MKIGRLSIIIIILFLVKVVADAQKIGYLDYELFMATLPEVQAVHTTLDTLEALYYKKGVEMVEAYKEKLQVVQKLGERCFPPKDLMEKVKKLQGEEQKIVDFEKEMKIMLAKESNKLMNSIHEKLKRAIGEIAKEQGYLFILNSQAAINDSQFLSYKEDADDITLLLNAKLE